MNPAQWTWRTSSKSATSGECVQIAWPDHTVAIRDSKNPAGGHLTIQPAAHTAFVTTLKSEC